eukprot:g7308.t1
MCTFANGIIRG